MGIYEYTMQFDNNTILPSYGKRTTNRRVVSFVRSVHVNKIFWSELRPGYFLSHWAVAAVKRARRVQRVVAAFRSPFRLYVLTWRLSGYSPDDRYKNLVIPIRVLVRVEKTNTLSNTSTRRTRKIKNKNNSVKRERKLAAYLHFLNYTPTCSVAMLVL